MPDQTDYYQILNVPPDASPEEIRRAYHKAARDLHPDMNPASADGFILVQQAYEVLSNLTKRAAYDARLEKEKEENSPVLVKTTFSRKVLPSLSDEQLFYALIEIQANNKLKQDVEELYTTTPFNLCLVLDTSTSMQGERLDTVKAAAIELVRQLGPMDYLSIVTFNDRAEVLLPATSQPDLKDISTRIRMIRAHGGTEIYSGLEAGLREVARNLSPNTVNHLILLTDGRTYGDEPDCLRLADQAARMRISISGLGMGEEWNDVFLDDLTARTGGNCTYLSHPSRLHNYLQEKLHLMGSSIADQLILDLRLGQGVRLRDAYRLSPEATPLNDRQPLQLGSLPRDDSLTVLLEFLINPLDAGVQWLRLAEGELRLHMPLGEQTEFSERLLISRPVQANPPVEYPTRPLVQALSRITLYRMQERARMDMATGNVDSASQRLHNLASHLLSQGNHHLARTVLREADQLRATHSLTAEGEKRLKYGTRAFLLPSKIRSG